MDHPTAALIAASALPVGLAALLIVMALWQPRFLRHAIARHPRGVDRGYRAAMVALFAISLAMGAGWQSLIFLLFAILGTALGRRQRSR